MTSDLPCGLGISRPLGCKMLPIWEKWDQTSSEVRFAPLPLWGTSKAAFPTVFSSLSHTHILDLSLTLPLLFFFLSKMYVGNWTLVFIHQVLIWKLWLWADGLCKHPDWLDNCWLDPISFSLSLFPPSAVSVPQLIRLKQHGLLSSPNPLRLWQYVNIFETIPDLMKQPPVWKQQMKE